MTQDQEFTPAKATRILLKGDVPAGMVVRGSLDLRGTAITALPDNLTVHGWLDLRGANKLCTPTPWWSEKGEATKRRCIAISDYALIELEGGKFIAGCRGPWTKVQCVKHWGDRIDNRAVAFMAALQGVSP